MLQLPLRPLTLGCVLGLLSSLPASPQNTWHVAFAADGVTLVDVPYAPSQAKARGPVLGSASLADVTYFEENGGGGGPRGLYDFVPSTGLSTLRTGVGGTQRFFGLAKHPFTGLVYGVDTNANAIYTVDPNSGATTFVIGLLGVTTVTNITFHPITGQLFGSERNAPLRLFTIDLGTGITTTIGTMTNVRAALTFGPGGTLFGCTLNGTLYRVDPASGAETLVGGGGGPGLAEDGCARPDGVLFVADYDGDIFRVDPATGANTLVGNSGSGNGLLGMVEQPPLCGLVLAAEAVRLGAPANPNALRPGITRPIIGATWDPGIDHTTFLPGASTDVLAIGTAPLSVTTPFGTLLCSIVVTLSGSAGVRFAIPLPDNCSLVGANLCTQGASTNGTLIALTNALDIRIGSF